MAETLQLGPRASRARLARTLDALVVGADRSALVRADPVELVRAYEDPHDREVAGLIVAMLAYGRVASIKDRAAAVLEVLGPRPAAAVDAGRRARRLSGFVYRFQKGEDLPRFLAGVRAVRKLYGSLGAAFAEGVDPAEPRYVGAMGRFVATVRAAIPGPPSYGLRYLMPDPSTGGAAKRLCLYLRWMIREDDGLDLGAWRALAPGLDPARLVIPLDTHIARIARYVGLTERKSDDLVCALEITEALARLAPADPLRYDMALCHLGISGQCPRRRDPVLCEGCQVRAVCRLGPTPRGWRR